MPKTNMPKAKKISKSKSKPKSKSKSKSKSNSKLESNSKITSKSKLGSSNVSSCANKSSFQSIKSKDRLPKSKTKNKSKKSLKSIVRKYSPSCVGKVIGSKSAKSKTSPRKKDKTSKSKSKEKLEKSKSSKKSEKSIKIPSSIVEQIKKIESTRGAIMVRNESSINTAGYFIEKTKLNQTEYSTIIVARKTLNETKDQTKTSKKQQTDNDDQQSSSQLVVKITNLTECTPRFRANLLKNSVRIMRYVSTIKKSTATSIFIKIHQIFQMDSSKLYTFMDQCLPNPTLYDLVKSEEAMKPEDIRNYFKAIVSGVNALQNMGVAHRYLKIGHILFDENNQPKLCGWSKAVLAYDISKGKLLMQNKERRVRSNCFLPPEAFQGLYDPLKADIWSLGVILVTMCTKRYPFNVRDEKTKFNKQWRNFIRQHEMNIYARILCSKIFILNPNNRIKCDKILTDDYFKVGISKLIPLSIRADDQNVALESSRVGALSGIEYDAKQEEEAGGGEEGEGDGEGGEGTEDGGVVGQEGNDETQGAGNKAPEEAEDKANPAEA